MYQIKSNLPEQTRLNVINELQKRLCDSIDLMQQAKHAHWNVRGDNFISLHELFDRVHEDVEKSVDLIAERIAQLGGIVEGTCKVASRNSSLPDYPNGFMDSKDHVEHFSNALLTFSKGLHYDIERSTMWKDAVTTDLLVQVSRNTEKNLWFVASHLPVDKGMEQVQDKFKNRQNKDRSPEMYS